MLGSDLATAIGARLPVVNDCRAFTLSEARLGAGQGAETVLGLIMGTGLAGGVVINGKLLEGPNGQAGEFGHLPLPYETVTRLGLPWLSCGCGRRGCYETLCSGPGLSRLAEALDRSPHRTASAFLPHGCRSPLGLRCMGDAHGSAPDQPDPDP